jgi:hypothetical protein
MHLFLFPLAAVFGFPFHAAESLNETGSMPHVGAGAEVQSPLNDLVDPLPLVVRDLPDEASRRAIREFDSATLLDPTDAEAMFRHAWDGLKIPAGQRAPLDELELELLPPIEI